MSEDIFNNIGERRNAWIDWKVNANRSFKVLNCQLLFVLVNADSKSAINRSSVLLSQRIVQVSFEVN